jgi:hypothetical protein
MLVDGFTRLNVNVDSLRAPTFLRPAPNLSIGVHAYFSACPD